MGIGRFFERDDPELPGRLRTLGKTLLVGVLLLVVATVEALRRSAQAAWSPEWLLVAAIFAGLLVLALQAWRMLRAWSREIVAEREARSDRQRRQIG